MKKAHTELEARLRAWGSPTLLFFSLLVVLSTGYLTYRQRANLAALQRNQIVLETVNRELQALSRIDAYEADLVLNGIDVDRTELFEAVVVLQRRLKKVIPDLRKYEVQIARFDELFENRQSRNQRLRSRIRIGQVKEARAFYSETSQVYNRAASKETLNQIAYEETGVLDVGRAERDRQTDVALYLVATVTALLAVLGFAAQRERTRTAVEADLQVAREEAERLRSQQVIESLGDGFLALDSEFRFTFVNASAEGLLRRNVEDLLGREVFDVFPHLESTELATRLRRAKVQREATSFIFATGASNRTLSFRTHAYQDGLAVHIRDISEERRLEAISRRDQALAEAVVRDVPYGVILTDDAGNVQRTNAAARTLRGSWGPSGDIQGWFAASEKSSRPLAFSDVVALAARRGVGVEERMMLRADGSMLAVQLAVTRIADPDGAFGYAIVVTDLSAQREARLLIEKSRDNALALARAKSEFLANMSHEIRTPLNGVLGIAEILAQSSLDEEQTRYLTTLRSSGQVLLRVINDVLDISKIEAGRLSISPSNTDLPQAIDEFVRLFEGAAREKGLRLEIEGLAALPQYAYLDATRLKQIVGNLLANAIKFSTRGSVGIVCSAVRREMGERLRITVSDQGIGIPSDRLESIFDSFSQAESSHARRYGGTGLGLTICKRLVELMGGAITVQSAVGFGSTFTVELPLQTPVEIDAPVGKPQAGIPRAIRILVAEDNETNVLVARHHLAALDCETLVVGNGQEALDAMASSTFDLVLMDVHMPELDGLEATRRWRETERDDGRYLPIFALTASALTEDVSICLDAGMNGVLHKPYTRAELLGTIERALEEFPSPEIKSISMDSPA